MPRSHGRVDSRLDGGGALVRRAPAPDRASSRGSATRAGLRRAIGDLESLRDPRRAAAVVSIGIVGGLMATLLVVHDHAAGADAVAYWHAARTWLAGGDPFQPTGPWLPYVYAIWLLPLFVPWALLPWPLAWLLWRGAMVALFAATFVWAYRRRPLGTTLAFLALGIPIGLVLDSGNIAFYLVFGLWAAQFAGPRTAAVLWALATATKWIPVAFFPVLTPRGRRWGLALMAIAMVLSLATWPETVEQIRALAVSGIPSGQRGILTLRVDHLVFLWAAIPWLWGIRARDPVSRRPVQGSRSSGVVSATGGAT